MSIILSFHLHILFFSTIKEMLSFVCLKVIKQKCQGYWYCFSVLLILSGTKFLVLKLFVNQKVDFNTLHPFFEGQDIVNVCCISISLQTFLIKFYIYNNCSCFKFYILIYPCPSIRPSVRLSVRI
jgi:hypothetical protein